MGLTPPAEEVGAAWAVLEAAAALEDAAALVPAGMEALAEDEELVPLPPVKVSAMHFVRRGWSVHVDPLCVGVRERT